MGGSGGGGGGGDGVCQPISPHYRLEGRRQGSGAFFFANCIGFAIL